MSDFAIEMFNQTRDMIADEYKDRIEVIESSTGDEAYENFMQRYAIGGKPLNVYLIGLFDAGIMDDGNWYGIEGASCDDKLCEEYEDFYLDWRKGRKNMRSVYLSEAGPIFKNINDALLFVRDFNQQGK